MELAVRFLLMIITTLLFTSSSFIILLSRRLEGFLHFNAQFLEVFGINQSHPSWLRWFVSSLLCTATASLLMVLLINTADTINQLFLPSGIGLDPFAIPLLTGLVVLFGVLIICAAAVVLASPIASPIALAILAALQFHAYRLTSPLSLATAVLFFSSILTGAVSTIISLYLILRKYAYRAILSLR